MDDETQEDGHGHAADDESATQSDSDGYGASQGTGGGEGDGYGDGAGASEGDGYGDGGSSSTGTGSWHAVCESRHGILGGDGQWFGPNHQTSDEAQSDADAHNAAHPGHQATVVYSDLV